MTNTAAYNANEVAAVYMSLNRDDLLSSDEGGGLLSKDDSLKNGFYGLSDPLKLRGLLQAFEGDFSQGTQTMGYKIRILNPTTELEETLFGFYGDVFPANGDVFTTFKDANLREQQMTRVEAATGEVDEQLLANNVAAPMPIIYLRFGYGTNSDSGLSRIHKAQVHDIKYIVSDSEDKVIELNAVDLFSYSKQNPSFNKRPFAARVAVTDSAQGTDNQISLRKPSEILTDIFASYLSTYPQCVPIVDLGEYKDDLDNLVYSVAAALARGDEIDKQNKLFLEEGGDEEDVVSNTVTAQELDENTIELIEQLLDRPLNSKASLNRGVAGTVTPQILYQAFKMVFEQIGLKWELNSVDSPEPVTGPLNAEQIKNLNTQIGKSSADNAKTQVDEAKKDGVGVNLRTEILNSPANRGNYLTAKSTPNSVSTSSLLSFWPMAIEDAKPADQPEGSGLEGNVLGKIKKIEPYGSISGTQAWAGLAPTDCRTYNATMNTGGCGTAYDPGEPPRLTTVFKGVIVEFEEDGNQIRQVANPVSREYFYDDSIRFATKPGPPTSLTQVLPSFSDTLQLYYPPRWYAIQGQSQRMESNNDPIKVKFRKIQGSTQLNGGEYYLYQPDSTINSNRFLLLTSPPPEDGSIDLDWVGKNNPSAVSEWEQGTESGEMWLGDTVLESPTPDGSNRVIRPLTDEEKANALANNQAPIWISAGIINEKNYEDAKYKTEDKDFKFYFDDISEISNKTSFDEFNRSRLRENYTLPLIPTCVPVNTFENYDSWLAGPATNTSRTREDVIPLYDLQTNSLYPASEYSALPEGEFFKYAEFVWETGGETFDDYTASSTKGLVTSATLPIWSEINNNPPLLNLEPTAETTRYLLNIEALKRRADVYEEVTPEVVLNEPTPPQPSPEEAAQTEFAAFIDLYSNAYVTMGDDGVNQHVSAFLENIINNINRLIVGKSSKLRVQQIQVNMLSEEDRKILSQKVTALNNFTWDEDWVAKNNAMLLFSPSDDISSQWTDNIIRPILSFPQTFDASAGNSVIYLDYGTPNSIVAKVDFTGDTRVLINLAQSNYSVRQFHDIKTLFDGTNTLSKDMITNTISLLLQDKIQQLLSKAGAEDVGESQEEQLLELVDTTRTQLGKLREGRSEADIDAELLDMLPTLLSSYETDEDLALVIGENSAGDIRKLASVISNPQHLNFLFPDANVDGGKNENTTDVLKVTDDGVFRDRITTKILRRRIDFDTIRARISDEERARKNTDVSYNFNEAMGQETFGLQITTLGIPEIDDPASEYLSRKVFFKFYDPRFANGQLHWLSGVYNITGFKHRINPAQGFLTQLDLIKNPTYQITNVRDMR